MTYLTIFLDHAAWPVVVIFALFLFRRPLGRLIDRIIRFRGKGFDFDLAGLPVEIQKKIGNKVFLDITRENLNYEKYLDAVMALGIQVAMFASLVRKFDKGNPLLELGDLTLKIVADKVKAERPTDPQLKFLSTKLKTKVENRQTNNR